VIDNYKKGVRLINQQNAFFIGVTSVIYLFAV